MPRLQEGPVNGVHFSVSGARRRGVITPNTPQLRLQGPPCALPVQVGGLLVLSVPIGMDTINWNMHRIYGTKRLPLLLQNWRLLDVTGYGFGERYLGHDGSGDGHDGGREAEYQPILVLENTGMQGSGGTGLTVRWRGDESACSAQSLYCWAPGDGHWSVPGLK